MAGHSQFSNIMHRKGAQDKKRAKIFSKLAKEITVAAKMGLPDPDMNPRLRAAIQAAKSQNMPKDNVKRAIDKSQSGDDENYDEIRYEGYGPGGVAVVVEALTDNRNRTASEVRSAFTKSGGAMAETGAVSFMFDRVGVVEYPAETGTHDEMIEAAIEAGADDVESHEHAHEIICEMTALADVAKALEDALGEPSSAALVWRPQTRIALDEETAPKMMKLVDALEDNDDVQHVYANFEAPDAPEET